MSMPEARHRSPARERGLSLIELIMFIIIVAIGVTALLAVFSTTVRKSADPMIEKQMLAIAESLLEEVEGKPFTYCDPDDANAVTATSAAGCTTPEGIGTEGAETRSGGTPFDNVSDYNGYAVSPYTDLTGTTTIAGYSASVSVANSTALNGLASSEALLITVTVIGPGNASLSLQGYRTRYAPNAVP
ncbi:MAG TPA: type II secretion system protein [Burkholderiales bacterium]|nr:type II secretion system protein [Burkholderiales bacterium]